MVVQLHVRYCKFGNFRENLFSRIALKDIFATKKKLRLERELHVPTSVNERVISQFREGFIFMKLREIKTRAKISEYTVSKAHTLDILTYTTFFTCGII